MHCPMRTLALCRLDRSSRSERGPSCLCLIMSIVNRPANTLDPALAADAWAAVSTWAKLPAVNAAIDAEHLSFSRHSVCYSGRLRRQPVPLERAFVVSRLPPGRPTLTPALIKLIAMSDAEAQSYHIARPMAVQKAAHGEHNHRIQILSRHECVRASALWLTLKGTYRTWRRTLSASITPRSDLIVTRSCTRGS